MAEGERSPVEHVAFSTLNLTFGCLGNAYVKEVSDQILKIHSFNNCHSTEQKIFLDLVFVLY